mgnify:CR=1 FL=1
MPQWREFLRPFCVLGKDFYLQKREKTARWLPCASLLAVDMETITGKEGDIPWIYGVHKDISVMTKRKKVANRRVSCGFFPMSRGICQKEPLIFEENLYFLRKDVDKM